MIDLTYIDPGENTLRDPAESRSNGEVLYTHRSKRGKGKWDGNEEVLSIEHGTAIIIVEAWTCNENQLERGKFYRGMNMPLSMLLQRPIY